MFKEVVLKSCAIFWQKKYLWALGLMSGFLMIGASYDLFGSILGGNYSAYSLSFYQSFLEVPESGLPSGMFANVIAPLILVFLSFVLLFWLGAVGRAGIILESWDFFQTKAKQKKINFGEGLKTSFMNGREHGWKVFWTVMFFKAIIAVCGFVFVYMLIRQVEKSDGLWLFILCFTAAGLVVIFAEIILNYVLVLLVARQEKISLAFKNAIAMFSKNFGASLSIFLIVWCMQGAFALSLILVLYIVSEPWILVFALVSKSIGSLLSFVLLVVPYLILNTIIVLLSSSFIAVWTASVWTGMVYKIQQRK